VELEDVQVVGLHPPQALVDRIRDVLTAVIVQPGQRDPESRALARREPGHIQRAPALGGQEELPTAAGETAADVLLGLAVVHRDVDIVDARIQHRVQDALGLAGGERPADARDHAAQLQRAEAERGRPYAGPSEGAFGEVWHDYGSSFPYTLPRRAGNHLPAEPGHRN
jgi:hypothetical protein